MADLIGPLRHDLPYNEAAPPRSGTAGLMNVDSATAKGNALRNTLVQFLP